MSKVKSKGTEELGNRVSRPVYFTIFIVVLILVSIAYATLAVNLGIKVMGVDVTGVKPIETVNWKIEFDNIRVIDGSINPIMGATIDETKTGIDYSVQLRTPGEFYSFKVDIVNSGSKDAKIYEIVDNGITSSQRNFLEYSVRYSDGSIPKVDDTLTAGETKTLLVTIRFKENLEISDLPSSAQNINCSYRMVYVEK